MEKERIAELVESYKIDLVEYGEHAGNLRIYVHPTPAVFAEIKEGKPEIVAYLKARKEEELRPYRERQAKIDAIPGLKEIRAAWIAHENYREEISRRFDSEDGMLTWPKEPQPRPDDLMREYPKAAAMYKAEQYAQAENFRKAEAGKKAVDRILAGDDPAAVIEEMSHWAAECIWD